MVTRRTRRTQYKTCLQHRRQVAAHRKEVVTGMLRRHNGPGLLPLPRLEGTTIQAYKHKGAWEETYVLYRSTHKTQAEEGWEGTHATGIHHWQATEEIYSLMVYSVWYTESRSKELQHEEGRGIGQV